MTTNLSAFSTRDHIFAALVSLLVFSPLTRLPVNICTLLVLVMGQVGIENRH